MKVSFCFQLNNAILFTCCILRKYPMEDKLRSYLYTTRKCEIGQGSFKETRNQCRDSRPRMQTFLLLFFFLLSPAHEPNRELTGLARSSKNYQTITSKRNDITYPNLLNNTLHQPPSTTISGSSNSNTLFYVHKR